MEPPNLPKHQDCHELWSKRRRRQEREREKAASAYPHPPHKPMPQIVDR